MSMMKYDIDKLQNAGNQRKTRFWKKILIILLILAIVLSGLSALAFYYLYYGKPFYHEQEEDLAKIGEGVIVSEKQDESQPTLNPKNEEKKDEAVLSEKDKKQKEEDEAKAKLAQNPYVGEITNILIIGVDARDPKNIKSNADVLMILTINAKDKTIKLSSIQRDLLVYVPQRQGFHKINSLMYAGPMSLMENINYNFQLNLDKFIVVNFQMAEQIVDLLGGIDLDIPQNQALLDYWNDVLNATNKSLGGEEAPAIKNFGLQHVNGRQAITYARLRKLDTDFQRMQRQQLVLSLLFKKLREAGTLQQISVLKKAIEYTVSNLSPLEISNLAGLVMDAFSSNIQTLQIPMEGFYKGVTIKGTYYTVQRINAQLPTIHKFIYGTEGKYQLVEEYYPEEASLHEKDEDTQENKENEEKEKGVSSDNNKDTSSPNEPFYRLG